MSFEHCMEDQLIQQHSLRSWLQLCGCAKDRACNPLHYFGRDCHLFEIAVVEENIQGSILPLRVLKGTQGEWCHVGTVSRPPGRQRFVMSYFEPCIPYLPFFHSLGKRPFNVYETVGDCPHPNNPSIGWSSYVQIYNGVRLEQRRSVTRTSRTSQAPVDNQLLGTVDKVLRYVPLLIKQAREGVKANVQIAGIAYDCIEECPSCGPEACATCERCQGMGTVSKACPWERYYVVKHDTTNNVIFVEGVLDDQCTITSTIITPSVDADGCTVVPTDIAVYNGHVYVSMAGDASTLRGVWVAPIYGDGTLGSFRRGFCYSVQSMTTCGDMLFYGGYAGGTTDGRILSSRGVVCNCDGDETARLATNVSINDMDCCGRKILAGGDVGLLAMSHNKGFGWSVLNSPTADKITAVGLNGNNLWVGTETGNLYTSCNNGVSWQLVASVTQTAEIQLTGEVAGGAIKQIEFANSNVGYFTSGNELYGTYDCGDHWAKGCPRFEFTTGSIAAWESDFCYTALAFPRCADWFESSSYLALGAHNAACGLVLQGHPMIEGMNLYGGGGTSA